MTTYEWLGLISVLIGGFWKLSNKLTRIAVALSGKVGFDDCAKRQGDCPCRRQVEQIQETINGLHPPRR